VAELVGEHRDLAAVVGFVGQHVAEHARGQLGACGPWFCPAVAHELGDALRALPFATIPFATIPFSGFSIFDCDDFGEHRFTSCRALGECLAGLQLRAVRAVELGGDFEMRRGEPDPLGADVVHVREDRRNGADVAGWLGCPDRGSEMGEEELVQALVSGEDAEGELGRVRANIKWLWGCFISPSPIQVRQPWSMR
jgi:hypothetical protein